MTATSGDVTAQESHIWVLLIGDDANDPDHEGKDHFGLVRLPPG